MLQRALVVVDRLLELLLSPQRLGESPESLGVVRQVGQADLIGPLGICRATQAEIGSA
jgi:hypothetical protein